MNSPLSQAELQTWAEQVFERPRTLQELPLILVPPNLLSLPTGHWKTSPAIQSAIQNWLEEAGLDDERLRLERQLIPHAPIYLPDTSEGQKFFRLAKAIADIPLNALILPKNQDQGYWLKTLHYYWQARGVVIAQQLLGVIPDPLGESGVLRERLSDQNLECLRLSSAIDIACLQLLTHGELYIQRWAKKNQVAYPFETPGDLFLELLREDFLVIWQLGPGNQEESLSKAKQRDNLAVRVRLLRQSPWLNKQGNRQDYNPTEQEYLQYLQQAGWSGHWLLALRPHMYEQRIEADWEAYTRALSKGKELTVSLLDWLRGEPFARPMSNSHRGVEGTLDLLGYIRWIWI
ncbi:hypothetical protein [Leptolyngbya sp. FACHB-711]|uniref:hypothetical protein n=1 Tax=Leptolyngbya sp. FACHB-711 TaxID=2692813 RepID=UPI0016894C19|nr:hypothetical protein [Leptolyngbya sp. FACHB-711]MBD2023815.1 hypothetical protein [Leptolyngbya sp. FACHB-711]